MGTVIQFPVKRNYNEQADALGLAVGTVIINIDDFDLSTEVLAIGPDTAVIDDCEDGWVLDYHLICRDWTWTGKPEWAALLEEHPPTA